MNHDNNPQQNIQENILEKIRTRKLTMRPRAYFTLKLIALIVTTCLVLLISIFLFSFILFGIRASGRASFLGYGPRGIELFLLSFPWKFLLIDIIFIAALEWLLRKFSFGYKRSIIYLLLGLIVVTGGIGTIVDQTIDLHSGLSEKSERHELPFMGGFYRDARRPPPHHDGFCMCTITELEDQFLLAEDKDFEKTEIKKVVYPDNFDNSELYVGEQIFVAGQSADGQIQAFEIRIPPPLPH